MAVPLSTYRLQFHAGFTFRDATAIVPYLHELGITHCYASPYFQAAPGSTHGYDVVDHNRLNPEIGTEADFRQWVATLREHGMGHILDIVPNHVGVGTNENRRWNDVLENGPASESAEFFDIDWTGSSRPEMHGRVLLPVLGESYAKTLEAGRLQLKFDDSGFAIHCFDRRFPIAPTTWPRILLGKDMPADLEPIVAECRNLTAQRSRSAGSAAVRERLAAAARSSPDVRRWIDARLRELNGRPGEPESFDRLDQLLGEQSWRLAWWRVAAEEINYRRFFDINDLTAIRMDRPEVFRATHELVFRLIRDGSLQGLRIDHPDGLLDPRQYLARLQEAAPGDGPLYVVVEKILAFGEPLRSDWPVAGTTGYDFLAMVNGLFVRSESESALTELYAERTGCRESFADLCVQTKRMILRLSFPGDLHMLARRLDALARKDRAARDFTLGVLTDALRAIIASFPVYRSYICSERVDERDRLLIESAIDAAKAREPAIAAEVFDFIRKMLLQDSPRSFSREDRAEQLTFAGRFQQLAAPVTAKGVEDTAFYRYHRLDSLNEVGGDPGRFGTSPAELHQYLADRRTHWPGGLSPLSTHDTKRGEDVRARIHVLSEIPDRWAAAVSRWTRINAKHRSEIRGTIAPTPNDEYLLYQTLIGAWPLGPTAAEFTKRIQAYMRKALREAKTLTSWTDPNAEYESAIEQFVAAILAEGSEFRRDFEPFQRRINDPGMWNSLSQTLVRIAAPGVPDTYQGTELWDFSLVDPDNRRPVDYAVRQQALRALAADSRPRGELAAELLRERRDGRIKLFLTRLGLRARLDRPKLFSEGRYIPGACAGNKASHVFGFARALGDECAIMIVPRLTAELCGDGGEPPIGKRVWGDTAVELQGIGSVRTARNLFTDEPVMMEQGRILVADALACFPAALLLTTPGR